MRKTLKTTFRAQQQKLCTEKKKMCAPNPAEDPPKRGFAKPFAWLMGCCCFFSGWCDSRCHWRLRNTEWQDHSRTFCEISFFPTLHFSVVCIWRGGVPGVPGVHHQVSRDTSFLSASVAWLLWMEYFICPLDLLNMSCWIKVQRECLQRRALFKRKKVFRRKIN